MASAAELRPPSAPPLAGAARGFLRWVCTNNPFYVLSAGLFLAGLFASFEAQAGDIDTWALLSGLAGYTLLLAGTAFVLVRFLGVWDDARTVLLLVVLLFLATSVTFDELLVLSPGRGVACYLLGLALAVGVSEGLLRGIRLRLPAGFRLPYYLLLGLFFLYPLALRPLVGPPRTESLLWGLFGFAPAAGLVALTLLPAARRGPGYVADNGSPWRWPLYPWVLFGLLGLAVPARAFLLCWSMDLLAGDDRGRLIFGPYFVVPFGLAVAVVLLEIGLASGRRGATVVAMLAPLGLTVLAAVGHRDDPIYRGFLDIFTARLGGTPLFLTLLASLAFYAYAGWRRAPLAAEGLTAALAALALVHPDTLTLGEPTGLQPLPLLAGAALQLVLGLWRRSAWNCLLAAVGLVIAVTAAVPAHGPVNIWRVAIAYHLVLFTLLLIGGVFRDELAALLRSLADVLVLVACLAALGASVGQDVGVPLWLLIVYPLALATLAAGYGWLVGHPPAVVVAALVLVAWTAVAGWRGYRLLRELVPGLDQLALSLALFALAVIVSLKKSGHLSRWLSAWGLRTPTAPPGDVPLPERPPG